MKKLTASVFAVVLSSSFMMVSAQNTKDTLKTKNIEEIVVTGALGIKRKADAITNTQQVVTTKELNQASAPTAVQALTGKVSGLQINLTNNGVDPSYRVVLRGAKSITGNNQALIVIDNVISSADILQQIPPEAIENINVIKGLQGAALYGQQGVNGVIIVTTKRGTKSEKLQMTFNSSIDISNVFMLPKVQQKYGKGVQDEGWSDVSYGGTNYVPWENMSWGAAYDNPAIGGTMMPSGLPQADGSFIYEKYAPVKNFMSKFFSTGVLTQNGITATAGGADSYVSFSANRTENNFVVEGDKLRQNSFIFKAGKKIGKLKIDGNINYINRIVSTTNSSLYDDILQTPTNNNIKLYRNSGIEGYYTGYAVNPYWTIDHERYDRHSDYFSAILGLDYELNKNINITYNGNITTRGMTYTRHNDGAVFTKTYNLPGTSIDGITFGDLGNGDITSWFYESTSKERNYYGDLMINFNYELTDKIGLKFNIGNNIQDRTFNVTSVGGNNLDIAGWYHIKNVLNPDPFSSANLDNYQTNSRIIAGFANLDLSYNDYLFLNSTFRIEQSSVLSTRPYSTGKRTNPVYPYYSVGLSFVPTKAFQNLKGDILNYAKITGSFTRVGNTTAVDPYRTDEIGVFPTGFPFNGLSSYINNQTPTSVNIKPEFVNTLDFGLSLGFLKDRIRLDASVYQSTTDDLITARTASSTSGLTSILDNVGKMRLRGLELDLGLTPIKTSDFTWDMKVSYSTYRSKVLELADGADEVSLLSSSSAAVGIFAVKGSDFPVIKGSAFQRDDQGRIIVDSKGNPLTTSNLQVLGRATPDYILGFSTNIKYKGFTLSAMGDFRKGGKFVSFTKNLLAFTGGLEESAEFDRTQGYVVPNSVQNTGTAANPIYTPNNTPVGGAGTYTNVTNYFSSSAYRAVGENLVVDATALKIREIALSYDIPKSVLSSTFLNSLTVGVYSRNPFFKYADNNRNYADPETASTTGNAAGFAYTTQYPSTRSFGVNLKASF